MAKLETISVFFQGQDQSELDEAIVELKEKYGEDCALRLQIDVYSYPE
jgi:hypothetical protein